MAKYVIEDTTLTNTANAIREKTGKTDAITPSNFATEIADIQSGGGDTTQEDGLISGTLTEYSNDRVTKIRTYTFYKSNIKKVSLPNINIVASYSFSNSSIETVNVPSATAIRSNAFELCRSLTFIDLPAVTQLDTKAFDNSGVKTIILRSEVLCNLTNTNAFSSSASVYVPDNLVDSYKSATNWSFKADQIKPISELEGN